MRHSRVTVIYVAVVHLLCNHPVVFMSYLCQRLVSMLLLPTYRKNAQLSLERVTMVVPAVELNEFENTHSSTEAVLPYFKPLGVYMEVGSGKITLQGVNQRLAVGVPISLPSKVSWYLYLARYNVGSVVAVGPWLWVSYDTASWWFVELVFLSDGDMPHWLFLHGCCCCTMCRYFL